MERNQPISEKNIAVRINGNPIIAKANTLLSDLLGMEKPCGGHGKCGKCKVIAKGELSSPCETERALLSAEEIAKDVRLACLTYALGNCEIESLQTTQKGQILIQGDLPKTAIKPVFTKYGVCVDIGTTTLAARLYNTKGELLASNAAINPQGVFGADVISRVESALDGKAEDLANLIRNALNELLVCLAKKAAIDPKAIDGLVITGNTVMLSLLTQTTIEPFTRAPFAVKRLFGERVTAEALDLHTLTKNTPIYLPPCISAFVGADTVCAILATSLCEGESAMLADIGTNGEMALWHNGSLSVCSTAAGPAFEGVGISMGMRGETGAVDRVSILNGSLFAHVIGEGSPKGICGSGLVDAVACLLDLEILDKSGYLEEDSFAVSSGVRLSQNDIRMLQLAKSAISAGLLTLMKAQGDDTLEVSSLFVAGGFGTYLNPRNAARIGLLPKSLAERARAVGNAALTGAAMLLLNTALWENARRIAAQAVTVSLADSPDFAQRYVKGMAFEAL